MTYFRAKKGIVSQLELWEFKQALPSRVFYVHKSKVLFKWLINLKPEDVLKIILTAVRLFKKYQNICVCSLCIALVKWHWFFFFPSVFYSHSTRKKQKANGYLGLVEMTTTKYYWSFNSIQEVWWLDVMFPLIDTS